jgi:hypothetical protein
MSDVEKFIFLLTSHDFDTCKVVILGLSNMNPGSKLSNGRHGYNE